MRAINKTVSQQRIISNYVSYIIRNMFYAHYGRWSTCFWSHLQQSLKSLPLYDYRGDKKSDSQLQENIYSEQITAEPILPSLCSLTLHIHIQDPQS